MSDLTGTQNMPLRAIGPSGEELTRESLPPAETTRWVARRKAEVVAAIRGGLLTMDEACTIYQLSEEEIDSWCRLVQAHGLMGLRATRVGKYRARRGA